MGEYTLPFGLKLGPKCAYSDGNYKKEVREMKRKADSFKNHITISYISAGSSTSGPMSARDPVLTSLNDKPAITQVVNRYMSHI